MIMESRKSKSKSTKSGLQDYNHSDSTKELFHDDQVLNDVVSPNQERKFTPDPSNSNQEIENTLVRVRDQEERVTKKIPLEKDNTPERSKDQFYNFNARA